MDLNRIEPDWVGIGTGSNWIGFFRPTNRIEPVFDPEGTGFGRNWIEPNRNMSELRDMCFAKVPLDVRLVPGQDVQLGTTGRNSIILHRRTEVR